MSENIHLAAAAASQKPALSSQHSIIRFPRASQSPITRAPLYLSFPSSPHNPTMAFELRYENLTPLTGIIGQDRALYWLQVDAERLLPHRVSTTQYAYQVMGMAAYPVTVSPAACFYSPALLTSPILSHAQMCEALQGATTRPVLRALGVDLNDRTQYVLPPSCDPRPLTRRVPILKMLPARHVMVPPPPPVIDSRMAEMFLYSETPTLWPV